MVEKKKYEEAIGSVYNIVRTPKLNKILADTSQIINLYGATGNGKSMIATYKALSRIFASDKNKTYYVLAGKDITTLERRFVESKNSVFNWFPFKGKWKYTKQGTSGSKITLHTKTGRKYFYLTPFADKNTYGRVLGSTINGTLIDEAPECDEAFLKEIFTRTIRTKDTWLITTGNGGDPKHSFYTDIIDKSRTVEDVFTSEEMEKLGICPTPKEELRFIKKSFNDAGDIEIHEKSIMYHLSLEDNPVYTEKQLRIFYSMFPKGSFQYYSRILGIRGFEENNVFTAFVNEKMMITEQQLRERDESGSLINRKFVPYNIVFSVDSGGHVFSNTAFDGIMPNSRYTEGAFGTKDGGHTIMISASFDRDYRNILILDTYFPNEMEQYQNVELMNQRIVNISNRFPEARREYLFCDPADSSMLATLINRIRNVKDVREAIKRDSELGLDEKLIIGFIQQFMMQGRFKVLDTENNRKFLIPALTRAKQESDGRMFDNGSWEADVWDALKYIFMSLYRLLIEH